jgi:transposase
MNVRTIALSDEEHSALIDGWKNGKKHTFRSRCNMILLSNQGYDMVEIASLEGVTRQTVAHWLNRYESGGIASLHTAKGRGRPPIVRHDNKEVINKIEQLVEQYPQKIDQALVEIEAYTGKSMSKKTLQRILKKTAGAGSASVEASPSGRRLKPSQKPGKG